MAATSVSLGIDIGTSSCKAVAVGPDGSVVAAASADYPLYTPGHGRSEQDPEDWWTAANQCVRQVTRALSAEGAEVTAVGLSGQMHGLVALDSDNKVIRRAILWNDQRCDPECTAITEKAGGIERVIEATNNRLITGFTAGKIRWVRDYEPENFARLAKVLNPKDYLRFRMTGVFATDVSDASGTGLYDVAARRWSELMLEATGIRAEMLPQVAESTDVTGTLLPQVARDWNVSSDVPVFGGGGDAVIQTLSMGITRPGDIGVTLGTAGIVAAASDFCPDNKQGKVQVSCYNRPGYWHVMGVSLTAAGALQWLADTLQELGPDAGISFSKLVGLARNTPPGADGLLFVPYLAGERSPHYAPSASAGWVGLTRMHRLGHLVRSVIEGTVLNMREILETLQDLGITCERIIASGGATREPFWLQTMADIFGREVVTLTGCAEGGAYGAAITAGVGAGNWDSFDEAFANLRVDASYQPDPANHQFYLGVFEGHRRLFQDLTEVYKDVELARKNG
ncbi:xylulokinase [Arthrobacter mobilis]|uniref:Xylulose kinase n=1 Tax=Arthrobacter mobilis TaxID=2724944 RepID=A0A7X6HC55_9MICC|nr:xylulokinase [Arthrobacter mobilis]NKX54401.1 xylulokinase [Arthrobacter mobilis]